MHRFAARLAWLAAVIAMITAVAGPVLHSPLHHLAGDSCCGASTAQESSGELASEAAWHAHAGHSHCGGHSHSHASTDSPESQSQAPEPCETPQDSPHDCSLCQLISQAADAVSPVVMLPGLEGRELVSELVPVVAYQPGVEKPFSRGPPVA